MLLDFAFSDLVHFPRILLSSRGLSIALSKV